MVAGNRPGDKKQKPPQGRWGGRIFSASSYGPRRPTVNGTARRRRGAELQESCGPAADAWLRFDRDRRIYTGVSGPWPTVGGLPWWVRPEHGQQ